MKIQEFGLRTVLTPDACCFEATLENGTRELSMRVRVGIRSLNALVHERRFLNPLKYGRFAWQLWSHKVLRYASPFLWIGALIANAALAHSHSAYLVLLLGQCAIIVAGVTGFMLQHRNRALGILASHTIFVLTNLASLIAALRDLRGERMVVRTHTLTASWTKRFLGLAAQHFFRASHRFFLGKMSSTYVILNDWSAQKGDFLWHSPPRRFRDRTTHDGNPVAHSLLPRVFYRGRA